MYIRDENKPVLMSETGCSGPRPFSHATDRWSSMEIERMNA